MQEYARNGRMGNEPMKERFWPASIAALGIHGFVIGAMALGIPYPQGASLQNFQAEVVFISGSEGKKSDSQKEAHEEPTLEKITKISPTKKTFYTSWEEGNFSNNKCQTFSFIWWRPFRRIQ